MNTLPYIVYGDGARYVPDWIGKPANMELHPSLSSLVITLIFRVPGFIKVSIQGDPDSPSLRCPEPFVIERDRTGVTHDKSLANDPRLRRRVALSRLRIDAAPPRSIPTSRISLNNVRSKKRKKNNGHAYKNGDNPRLI